MTTSVHGPGSSAKAPHQLSPLPNASGAHSNASAAGLKMCPWRTRTSRLVAIAKPLVHATTSHDSLGDRMKYTISALRSALVGKRGRPTSSQIQVLSIRQAVTTAAARLGH